MKFYREGSNGRKAFFTAAIPWIVIGISIALLTASDVRRDSSKDGAKAEKQEGNHMTDGMCIRMRMGVVASTTGIDSLALGISLGMLAGLAVGFSIKK